MGYTAGGRARKEHVPPVAWSCGLCPLACCRGTPGMGVGSCGRAAGSAVADGGDEVTGEWTLHPYCVAVKNPRVFAFWTQAKPLLNDFVFLLCTLSINNIV